MSTTLFNMVVDDVIRNWMEVMVEDQTVNQNVLGETVGRFLGVFYSNNGMVISHQLYWMNHTMNVLVNLFKRYVLAANVAKSHTMTCQPRSL